MMIPDLRLKDPKSLCAIFLSTAFFILLWLPLADSSFQLDGTPRPNENRALAPFPALGWERSGLRGLFSELDSYYCDHFGFRNQLVRWNNRWKHDWFQDSSHTSVGIGQEGWLFFLGDYMLDNYLGDKRFSSARLEHWRQLLEKRRDRLARRRVKKLLTVAPGKDSGYPEYLPRWMVKSAVANNLDQFFTYMKAH